MSSGNAGALQVPLPVNRACAAFALMPQLLVKPVSLRLLKGCILRNMVENNLRGSEVKMSDKINATMATTCAKRLECLGMTPGILGLGEDIWLFRSVSHAGMVSTGLCFREGWVLCLRHKTFGNRS